MKAPWRQVSLIKELPPKNPNHGGTWILELECGHTEFRSKPRPTWARAVALLTGFQRIQDTFAPRRVRCSFCLHAAEGETR